MYGCYRDGELELLLLPFAEDEEGTRRYSAGNKNECSVQQGGFALRINAVNKGSAKRSNNGVVAIIRSGVFVDFGPSFEPCLGSSQRSERGLLLSGQIIVGSLRRKIIIAKLLYMLITA